MIDIVREFDEKSADLAALLARATNDHHGVRNQLHTVMACWCRAIADGKKLIFFGNGGSAAMAQHLAAECVGRFSHNRRALAAIALCADTAVITAIANDFGYEQIFSRQIEGLANTGDCLVGLSTSGRSMNIVHAIGAGSVRGCTLTMLTGTNAPEYLSVGDEALVHQIRVPSVNTARIQEVHLLLGHTLIGALEKEIA